MIRAILDHMLATRSAGVLVAFLLLFAIAGPALAGGLSEDQKIEALIGTVERLEGAVFVRNGTDHNCKEAAKHLRDKWKGGRKHIKTARDFIRVAATESSMSGKPYFIRFKDGKQVKSAEFFLAELKKLEK
jgi:hypothetical protein